MLIDEPGADLDVRAWRFSYNARGIIELPNHIRSDRTAAIMVHPWGIDDGQGWRTPEPAGVADFCTPEKNHLAGRHTREVVDPLLKRLRGRVSLVLFSLRSHQYPAQAKIYRSIRHKPTEAERAQGRRELAAVLNRFQYRGEPLPAELTLSDEHPVRDYFQQFPGLEAGARFNNAGFWDLPIPVTKDVQVFPDDVVYYDEEGYPALRDFLKERGVRHVILTGYATDMCFCRTTAGYENLSKDFNVFLVGDATLATYPANETPRYATNAAHFVRIDQPVNHAVLVDPVPVRRPGESRALKVSGVFWGILGRKKRGKRTPKNSAARPWCKFGRDRTAAANARFAPLATSCAARGEFLYNRC